MASLCTTADLQLGSFQLELMAPPEGFGSGSAGAAVAGSQQLQPQQASLEMMQAAPLASGFGHFALAVADTGAVLEALRAAGCGGLILEECSAVIPVRSHGQSHTVRSGITSGRLAAGCSEPQCISCVPAGGSPSFVAALLGHVFLNILFSAPLVLTSCLHCSPLLGCLPACPPACPPACLPACPPAGPHECSA